MEYQWDNSLKEYMIHVRRRLHETPEESFKEKKTQAIVLGELEGFAHVHITRLAKTGIKAVFPASGDPKGTLAFRADMDALPVMELTQKPYASQNKGWMHACGHDGHMAILLGLCRWVSQNPLPFHVVAIFEPGEETTGGALPMIEQGALENPKVDAIFGLHIWPYLPKGKISAANGPVMAGMVDFDVEFQGRSAHGASKKDGADALFAAAQFVVHMNQLAESLEKDGQVQALNIGTLKGGSARNVVCDYVKLQGTLRYFEEKTCEKVASHMEELKAQLKKSLGVGCRIQKVMSYPPVVNDEKLACLARGVLTQDEQCVFPPQMMSEDFSHFQRQVPGVYAFLGSGEDRGLEPLHSGTFDFDEEILERGLSYYLRLLEQYGRQLGGERCGK